MDHVPLPRTAERVPDDGLRLLLDGSGRRRVGLRDLRRGPGDVGLCGFGFDDRGLCLGLGVGDFGLGVGDFGLGVGDLGLGVGDIRLGVGDIGLGVGDLRLGVGD
ncbi:MAG: hypothetical protein ACXWXP_07595, partial [Actinomycetota bacterium]